MKGQTVSFFYIRQCNPIQNVFLIMTILLTTGYICVRASVCVCTYTSQTNKIFFVFSPDDLRTITDLLVRLGHPSPVKMADMAGLGSDDTLKGTGELDPCLLEIDRKYEIVPAVISSTCCLFGIIYCFFGKLRYQLYF